MGIKEIKPSDAIETQFPSLVRREGTVYYPLNEHKDREEDLEKVIERVKTRQVLDAERRKLLSELKPEGIQPEGTEGKSMEKQTNPKRYLVDPETGVIGVDEENGECTYKDAVLISSSIKAKTGQYDQAISLINALQEWEKSGKEKTGEGITKKTEWYVDDETGAMVHDPENGDLTLSEARAVSQSKQRALVSRSQEIIGPKDIEIVKRDMRDETNQAITEEFNKLHKALSPKDEEQPFILRDGEIEPNPKAKIGVTELLLYQQIQQNTQLSKQFLENKPFSVDEEGNIKGLSLPAYLELDRHKRKEKREDEKSEAITSAIIEGKKQLPKAFDALKNMARSKKTEQAMGKGGWLGEGEGEKEEQKQTPCAYCHKNITYSALPSIIPCPNCGELNILGSSEQREQLMTQLGLMQGKEGALSKAAVEGSIATLEGTGKGAPVEQSTASAQEKSETAYCMKCKEKVAIKNPSKTMLKNGRWAVQGTCPKCDTKVSRMA